MSGISFNAGGNPYYQMAQRNKPKPQPEQQPKPKPQPQPQVDPSLKEEIGQGTYDNHILSD